MEEVVNVIENITLNLTSLVSFNRYIISGVYCILKLQFKALGNDAAEGEVHLSLTMDQCLQLSQSLSDAALVLELERPTAAQ
jgi:hypothetical protein